VKHTSPKKIRRIVRALFGLGVLLSIGGALASAPPAEVAGIAVLLGSLAVHFSLYRCPCCGKFLDRSSGDFCPYCGKNMNP